MADPYNHPSSYGSYRPSCHAPRRGTYEAQHTQAQAFDQPPGGRQYMNARGRPAPPPQGGEENPDVRDPVPEQSPHHSMHHGARRRGDGRAVYGEPQGRRKREPDWAGVTNREMGQLAALQYSPAGQSPQMQANIARHMRELNLREQGRLSMVPGEGQGEGAPTGAGGGGVGVGSVPGSGRGGHAGGSQASGSSHGSRRGNYPDDQGQGGDGLGAMPEEGFAQPGEPLMSGGRSQGPPSARGVRGNMSSGRGNGRARSRASHYSEAPTIRSSRR